MKARRLTRLYGVLLLAVALWPIGQWILVRTQDVNPWKLYGFAMYCTPHSVRMVLFDTTTARRPILGAMLPAELRRELGGYQRLRRGLGKLRPPDEVAAAVLDALPRVRSLEVQIHLTRLDPATSSLKTTQDVYRFERDD